MKQKGLACGTAGWNPLIPNHSQKNLRNEPNFNPQRAGELRDFAGAATKRGARIVSEAFFRGQKPFGFNDLEKNLGNEPNFAPHPPPPAQAPAGASVMVQASSTPVTWRSFD
jgi:hypothetical protein